MNSICKVEGCGPVKRIAGYGMCSKHYNRWKRRGTTEDPDAPEQRFWRKVEKTKDCWVYTGSLDRGYGQFWLAELGRSVPAHAYAYRLLVDPDNWADLDHLCHTFDHSCPGGPECLHRRCVNPAHLQPVTRGQNSARGQWRKDQCPHGHPYDDENTRITSSGYRSCRACDRARVAAYYRTDTGQKKSKEANLRKKLARAEARLAALREEAKS